MKYEVSSLKEKGNELPKIYILELMFVTIFLLKLYL